MCGIGTGMKILGKKRRRLESRANQMLTTMK
jgi:hypothetical protein